MSLPSLSLAVVGVRHANSDGSNRGFLIALCKPGDPVELRPERTNPADAHAVAVFTERDGQLGYLTAERASRIGALLRQGREVRAVFQAQAAHGAWIRAAFDGESPVVPRALESEAAMAGGDAESGFWPDPVWDE